jgi:hypothetical protein
MVREGNFLQHKEIENTKMKKNDCWKREWFWVRETKIKKRERTCYKKRAWVCTRTKHWKRKKKWGC